MEDLETIKLTKIVGPAEKKGLKISLEILLCLFPAFRFRVVLPEEVFLSPHVRRRVSKATRD